MSPPGAIGPYRILSTLGRGGTGYVLRAERDGRHFAVKCLHDFVRDDPELRARFVREGRLTASLSHPNLVRVHELAEAPDVGPYLVMDELRGVTLARALDADVPIPMPIARAILHALFAALSALHHVPAGSIVHGDLSPQNLIVGFDGRVTLIDLGLARADHATRVTRSEKLRGKLRYLAPEQLQASPKPTVASDQYAAAVIAWETLTGRPLIGGRDNRVRVARILAGGHPPPSAHRAEVPADLDTIVMRALQGSPGDRFGSLAELVAALGTTGLATEAEVGAWARTLDPEAAAAAAPAVVVANRRPLWLGLGLVLVGAGTVAGLSQIPRAAPTPTVTVSFVPDETPPPLPSLPSLPPEPAPSAPLPVVRPGPKRPVTPRPVGSCASPFSFDEHGIKTYRPGCL